MSSKKQQLLQQFRRKKRLSLLLVLTVLVLLSAFYSLWLLPLALVLTWVIHEAWFADHLFYSPRSDYHYQFPEYSQQLACQLQDGRLQLAQALPESIGAGSTLVLAVHLRSSWLGRLFDPVLTVGCDRQTFERGACGVRYLNLTGQLSELVEHGLPLSTRFCQVQLHGPIVAWPAQDLSQRRIMFIAPHADDAELAAFGLYSQAADVSLVTLTQGEIEAETYQQLGLAPEAAAKLKGRLRSWDSMAIPLWGGVPTSHCVQLGYYCLQLQAMQQQPSQAFGSKESGEADTRSVRQMNACRLPSDANGVPSWENLIADLTQLIADFKPELIVTPHPELDPHGDHIAATAAVQEALAQQAHSVQALLLYANHLADNDRWPMGNAGEGVALPPVTDAALPADELWSYVLSVEQQLDKALALAMQHDLQGSLPLKKRLRRNLQKLLLGRRWPVTGDNEFFRKAVRRHELFWVRPLQQTSPHD